MTTGRMRVDPTRKVECTRCGRGYVATVQLNSREGLFQVICPKCEEKDQEHDPLDCKTEIYHRSG